MQAYLRANDVPDERKVDAFISIVGPQTYALLKSLTAPTKPSSHSLESLCELRRKHLSPQRSVIAERAKLHRRIQKEHKTMPQYVAELRALAQTWELRDRFVCGLLRVDIQIHLFSEDKQLTFQRTVYRATALEAAFITATATYSKPGSEFEVHQLPTKETTKCSRCNSNPKASTRLHINATWFFCNKKGHIQKACRRRKQQHKGKRTAPHVRVLQPLEPPLQSSCGQRGRNRRAHYAWRNCSRESFANGARHGSRCLSNIPGSIPFTFSVSAA